MVGNYEGELQDPPVLVLYTLMLCKKQSFIVLVAASLSVYSTCM